MTISRLLSCRITLKTAAAIAMLLVLCFALHAVYKAVIVAAVIFAVVYAGWKFAFRRRA